MVYNFKLEIKKSEDRLKEHHKKHFDVIKWIAGVVIVLELVNVLINLWR